MDCAPEAMALDRSLQTLSSALKGKTCGFGLGSNEGSRHAWLCACGCHSGCAFARCAWHRAAWHSPGTRVGAQALQAGLELCCQGLQGSRHRDQYKELYKCVVLRSLAAVAADHYTRAQRLTCASCHLDRAPEASDPSICASLCIICQAQRTRHAGQGLQPLPLHVSRI